MIRTWIRVLYVRFYNEANTMSLTIGKSVDDSQKPMISVSGNKYLSPVKDNFTVKIYNLTYNFCTIYGGGAHLYFSFIFNKQYPVEFTSWKRSCSGFRFSVVILIISHLTASMAKKYSMAELLIS